MKLKNIFILVGILLLSGCEERSIDASTDESLERTTELVRDSLPIDRRSEFDEALQVLAFSQINMEDIFSGALTDPSALERQMKDSLHGKTAEEVIAEADRVLLERQAREREQAIEEIRELEAAQAAAEAARIELQSFEVLRSRFYFREGSFLGREPIIDITVRNGTSEAVSRAYFEGTIASPNRSVPWLQERFNYSISGGLEPDEEASWSLAPGTYSDWADVEPPEDAIFTATVYRLDGADGEALYSTDEFSDFEERRLNELREQFGN